MQGSIAGYLCLRSPWLRHPFADNPTIYGVLRAATIWREIQVGENTSKSGKCVYPYRVTLVFERIVIVYAMLGAYSISKNYWVGHAQLGLSDQTPQIVRDS